VVAPERAASWPHVTQSAPFDAGAVDAVVAVVGADEEDVGEDVVRPPSDEHAAINRAVMRASGRSFGIIRSRIARIDGNPDAAIVRRYRPWARRPSAT
jgi:hypothetical protein